MNFMRLFNNQIGLTYTYIYFIILYYVFIKGIKNLLNNKCKLKIHCEGLIKSITTIYYIIKLGKLGKLLFISSAVNKQKRKRV